MARKLTGAELSRSQSNRGKDLEQAIDAVHYLYRSEGLAYPIRNHPEIRIQRRDRKGAIVGYLKAKAEPDYIVVANETALIFDAKRSSKRNFPLQNIHPHQADALSRADGAGAFAFLLIQTPDGRYVVPWGEIVVKYRRWVRKDFKRGTGATALSAVELAELSIVSFRRRESPDYLDAVLDALSPLQCSQEEP